MNWDLIINTANDSWMDTLLGLIILWIIAISYLVMTWTEQHENL